MGDSNIGWTEKTWNPVRGCSRISPGCVNCYAEIFAGTRMSGPGQAYEGFATNGPHGPRWTGMVELFPAKLAEPLRWRDPALVFVNSMSDLFHERLSFRDIAAVFGIMALARRHTFQVLTKRADRMPEFFDWLLYDGRRYLEISEAQPTGSLAWWMADALGPFFPLAERDYQQSLRAPWPLPNVQLGVSVESRDYLPRLDHLRRCPAAVRFASLEPLLEDLGELDLSGIHWLIAGGESGANRRPAEVAWYQRIADQAAANGVPFFMKQDAALRPGRQGRIPAALWARKEMPARIEVAP